MFVFVYLTPTNLEKNNTHRKKNTKEEKKTVGNNNNDNNNNKIDSRKGYGKITNLDTYYE